MAKYVVKRILLAVLTVLVISVITFFAMNAIPGGPFSSEKALSPEVERVLMERYNLDKPVPVQYFIYMRRLLQGDFGVSLKTGREISKTVFESFAVSARLGGMAAVVAVIIGVVMGSIAALNRNRWPDRLIIFLSTLATAVPSFVLATLLLLIFCIQLGWFPVFSTTNQNYVLPVIALSLYPMAYITRLTKTSMLDALGQDYVRTARAKGVPVVKVIFKHALRNALIPVITYVGPMLAYILTGSLVVEQIFAIPGIGSLLVSAIQFNDYNVVLAVVFVYSVMFIAVMLAVDILYGVIDPRIRLAKEDG